MELKAELANKAAVDLQVAQSDAAAASVRRQPGAVRRRCRRTGHRRRQGQGRRLRCRLVPAGFGARVDERAHGRGQCDRAAAATRNCSARCPAPSSMPSRNLQAPAPTRPTSTPPPGLRSMPPTPRRHGRTRPRSTPTPPSSRPQRLAAQRSGPARGPGGQHDQQQADYRPRWPTSPDCRTSGDSTTSGSRRSRPRKRPPAGRRGSRPARGRGSRPAGAPRRPRQAAAAAGRGPGRRRHRPPRQAAAEQAAAEARAGSRRRARVGRAGGEPTRPPGRRRRRGRQTTTVLRQL